MEKPQQYSRCNRRMDQRLQSLMFLEEGRDGCRVSSQSPEEDAGGGRGKGKRFRAQEVPQGRKRPLLEPILRARAAGKQSRVEAR